jgi:hypothetical protein
VSQDERVEAVFLAYTLYRSISASTYVKMSIISTQPKSFPQGVESANEKATG